MRAHGKNSENEKVSLPPFPDVTGTSSLCILPDNVSTCNYVCVSKFACKIPAPLFNLYNWEGAHTVFLIFSLLQGRSGDHLLSHREPSNYFFFLI